MGNRNKKVVRMQAHGMMDDAVKDICDVSEDVMNQLEIKRTMMQNVLDAAEEGFRGTGVTVNLRLAEDGYELLYSDLQDYVADASDDEEDEDDIEAIELFGGEDEDGNLYSVMVMLMENAQEEDSFDMSIAILREKDEIQEILTDDGWQSVDMMELLGDD